MRNRITRALRIAITTVGTMLLTATGALAWQPSSGAVPGGLRPVGPPPAPVHEVPGGLRSVGPSAGGTGAEPAVDTAAHIASGMSLTWVLVLIAATAVVAAMGGYVLRASRSRQAPYVGTVEAR